MAAVDGNKVNWHELRRLPGLRQASDATLRWVQRHLQQRAYEAGETILHQGQACEFLGIVKDGKVDVVSQTPGGRSLVVPVSPQASFFVDGSAPSTVKVQASTPAVLWHLSASDFETLKQRLAKDAQSRIHRWYSFINTLRHKRSLTRIMAALTLLLLVWGALNLPPGRKFRADVCYARGLLHIERGEDGLASQDFVAALKLDPAHASSYGALGYLYYMHGDLDRARIALERAARRDATSDVIQNNLGVVRHQLGQDEASLNHFLRAADLSRNVAQVYANLGDAYMRQGDWQNAGRAYREALRIDYKTSETHFNLGVAYYYLGQLENAQGEFMRALQLNPWLGEAYLGLGLIDYEADNLEGAQLAFQQAVNSQSPNPTAYFYLGLTEKRLQNKDHAVSAFERALGLTDDLVMRQQAEWHLKSLWASP